MKQYDIVEKKIVVGAITLVLAMGISVTAFAEVPQGTSEQQSSSLPEVSTQETVPNARQGGRRFEAGMQGVGPDLQQSGGRFDRQERNDRSQFPESGSQHFGPDSDSAAGMQDFCGRGGMKGQDFSRQMPGRSPIGQIMDAVDAVEDENIRADLLDLLDAHLDALKAEQNAKTEEDRAEAAEAVAAAQEALNAALSEAGIDLQLGVPADLPAQPDDGMVPPELPEGGEFSPELPENRQASGQRA